MSIITIEACANGTVTRANARTLNRALAKFGAPTFSGSAFVADVCAWLDATDCSVPDYRVVWAAALAGTDKGRHTREVNRSVQAQARRAARKHAHAHGGDECFDFDCTAA
jgi:bifunctional N-acetylglucosamine-1-phosphate-uridyltransferase/glucosamine-1-phosphate-acetyltransferase GlmU-like protein